MLGVGMEAPLVCYEGIGANRLRRLYHQCFSAV